MSAVPALTMLTEDEQMLRDAVREYAASEIAPRAAAMEQAHEYDADLLKGLFEMGVMGVEIPE